MSSLWTRTPECDTEIEKQMAKLETRDCRIDFGPDDEEKMQHFLEVMKIRDEWQEMNVKTIRTMYDPESSAAYLFHGTDSHKIWEDLSMPSLEKRSGDDATGHKYMTLSQILASMNNYWELHPKKETALALIRGGRLMSLHSAQYNTLDQSDLFECLAEYMLGKGKFSGGHYTHEGTVARYVLEGGISEGYKTAWKKAGLSEKVLEKSSIEVLFYTNDLGTCKATVSPRLVMGTDRILLGEPITIMHRRGSGDLEDWKRTLRSIDMSIEEELANLALLMDVEIEYPENCAIRAAKKTGLHQLSKKSLKDLMEVIALYPSGTSAYYIYLSLFGITRTEHGEKLSEEKKLRCDLSIRKLLTMDWTRFDGPGEEKL